MLGRNFEQGPWNSDEEKNDIEALSLEDESLDAWSKSDEAAYKKKMTELDKQIEQEKSKKFKISDWSLFGKAKQDDDKKQTIEAIIAVTALGGHSPRGSSATLRYKNLSTHFVDL